MTDWEFFKWFWLKKEPKSKPIEKVENNYLYVYLKHGPTDREVLCEPFDNSKSITYPWNEFIVWLTKSNERYYNYPCEEKVILVFDRENISHILIKIV
jgi:hypothetical protein